MYRVPCNTRDCPSFSELRSTKWERLRIKFWAVKFEESVAGGSGAFGVSGYVALASEVRGKRGQLERQRDER